MKMSLLRLFNSALILIVSGLTFSSVAYFPDSTFLTSADSIFRLPTDSQNTFRKIKKDKHTYFMVTTCKTVHAPFASVVATLQNVPMYPEYFTFITKADKITNKNTPNDTVTMFVGGYGLYRVYFFGKIRQEQKSDSLSFRIFYGGVDQKLYRKAWKKKVRGFIKIGSHDVDIFWTAQQRSDSTTRISLSASQAFVTPIANWMVSIGTNRIFRGMLMDLEKHLTKKVTAGINESDSLEQSTTVPSPDSAGQSTDVPEPVKKPMPGEPPQIEK